MVVAGRECGVLGLNSCFSPSTWDSGLGKNDPITVCGVLAAASLVRDWMRRVTVSSYDLLVTMLNFIPVAGCD